MAGLSLAHGATLTVTATDGAIVSNSACSISEAIHNANNDAATHSDCVAGSGNDTINLSVNVTLSTILDTTDGSNGTPSITSAIILDGQGYRLTRDGTLTCNLDGTSDSDEFRLLHIAATGSLTAQNLLLENGCADGGNSTVGSGGAVFNWGSLRVTNGTLHGNQASNLGGAIANSGTLPSIADSTISGNSAYDGGGVFNDNTLNSITNSTFSGNSAVQGAGALTNWSSLGLIENSTFSGNTGGNSAAAGIDNRGASATIGNVRNTIVTNSTGPDCANSGGTFSTGSSNLTDDLTCPGDTTLDATKFITTLADNGCAAPGPNGCVETHALQAGSNALDTAVSGTANGQRGLGLFNVRDIGAYERQKVDFADCPANLVLPGFTTTVATPAALQQAMVCANHNGDNLADTLQLNTNIVLTGDAAVGPTGIFGPDGENGTPSVVSNIVLDGQGYNLARDATLTCNLDDVDDSGEFRLLHVAASGTLTVQNLHLANGCADGSSAYNGGAIFNWGVLTVTNSTMNGNQSNNEGGAIWNPGTILSITSSTISGNSAYDGGGVFNDNTLNSITNSTFSGNSAVQGAGAITNWSSLGLIENSTFSGNTGASGAAAGIDNYGASSTIGNARNTIVTSSTGGPDCANFDGTFDTGSNNLTDDLTCPGDTTLDAAKFNTTLADNSCLTPGPNGCVKTHALNYGSTALDNADNNGTPIGQRGFNAFNGRDIGAYESADQDGDGLGEATEVHIGTLPNNPDSDGDGIADGDEDKDGDGFSNFTEQQLGYDPGDSSDKPTPSFTDVSGNHPGFLAIEMLARNAGGAIVETCNGGTNFCPDEIVTRDTAAIWLSKIADGAFSEPTAFGNIFTDVESTDFAAGWIENLQIMGYSEGCAGTTINVDLQYCPRQSMTKNSAALMVQKAAGITPAAATTSQNPFSDVDIGTSGVLNDGAFAADWIVHLFQSGNTKGCNGTTLTPPTLFCPDEALTRAGLATMIAEVFALLP